MDGVVHPPELRLDRAALGRQASATAPIVR
jgi:hypothetical protein